MHTPTLALVLIAAASTAVEAAPQRSRSAFKQIEIESLDKLKITADLYAPHADKKTPFIVLCHQAGFSRGEYREIAPKLNKMGFNCVAIDQRSGRGVDRIENETAKRAAAAGKSTQYPDAEQDMIAAVQFVRKNHAKGKVILWGSSYSSALALRIAGDKPKLVDAVLAFAPGEYFARLGKPNDWVTQSAKKIQVPAFITSAKNEHNNWKGIYAAIPGKNKTMFLPKTKGNHGSRALWSKMSDNKSYWDAVTPFLAKVAGRPMSGSGTKAGSGKKAGSSKK